MIRVASNMISDTLLNDLTRLNSRQQQLQAEAASGLRVQNPGDDPTAMRRVLDLQAEASAITQYQKNIAQILNQIASRVAMSAKPTHNAASTHTFSIERSSLSCSGNLCRGHDSATRNPCQESSSVPAMGGTAVEGELLHLLI